MDLAGLDLGDLDLGGLGMDDGGKLSGYLKDLMALESEKSTMENQLSEAMEQQQTMVQRLDEMRQMMSMVKQMGGGLGAGEN